MKRLLLSTLWLALACLSGCSAEPDAVAAGASAKSGKSANYTLVFLKTGPKDKELTKEERSAAFAGHFENMGRMFEEHQLLVAGPFGKVKHDENLRGIFVLDTSKRDEAEAWASTDPAAKAGVFVLEYHDFATDAPLALAYERDKQREDQAKAEGRKLKPSDGARNYVLLHAEDLELARNELKPLLGAGGVLLLAELDGEKALALLDATDTAAAKERFGPVLDKLGVHAVDEWFASDSLAHLYDR